MVETIELDDEQFEAARQKLFAASPSAVEAHQAPLPRSMNASVSS